MDRGVIIREEYNKSVREKLKTINTTPDYTKGWIYYGIGIFFSFLFTDWISAIILCTILFLWWRKEQRNKRRQLIDRIKRSVGYEEEL